jgi:hypothetical protein
MYFGMKNTLKNNHNYILKQTSVLLGSKQSLRLK